MKTVNDLMEEMMRIARDPYHPSRESLSSELAGKLTTGKAKDWTTHGKYIAMSFEVASLAEVSIAQLDAQHASKLEQFLLVDGRGESVRRNTRNTYKLLREIAIAFGVLDADPVHHAIPVRHQLYMKRDGRRVMTREPRRKLVTPYAKRRKDFNPSLQKEVADLEHYYTARIVRGRKGKPLDESTWKANVDRMERFFGAMEQIGIPHEGASLSDFVDPAYLERYVEFFLEEHEDPTYTLKDLLSWAANVARNYNKDTATADEISSLINQMRFVRIKDLDSLVIKVTADDLYTLEDKLVQHAFAYDRMNYRRKPGEAVKFPQATTAWHYGRALAIMLANRCWFRRSNLFGIKWGQHLYYFAGKLHFKFSAREMKSKEPHLGQIVDLWRGQAGYNQLVRVLERYLEVRHHLVEKFRQNHPGEPEPAELLLNSEGRPYAPTGGWAMFSSVSRAYLGNEKEIHPHAPRLIVPTYLMLEYDYAILGSIQALLDHKSIQTTERHYLRMKRLLNGQAAQRVMDDREARDRQARSIEKMERMLMEMRSQFLGSAP